MKLSIFTLLFICLFIRQFKDSYSYKTKERTIISLLSKLSKGKLSPEQYTTQVPVISTIYWLKRKYAGKDPILFLEESWANFQQKYFILNDDTLYYGENKITSAIIEESLSLSELYDPNVDSAREGKCCRSLSYVEYSAVTKCENGLFCIKSDVDVVLTDAQKDSDFSLARFCIELFVYQKANWIICHWDKDEITKLKTQIAFQTVKNALTGFSVPINSDLMSKVIMSVSYAPITSPVSWNWIGEENWGGYCDSQVLQSPVPIEFDPTQVSIEPQFMFEYNFGDGLPVFIKKNVDEVVIEFQIEPASNNGFLKITYGTFKLTEKEFNPVRISFKFPSEHTINGNRYDGDIVINYREKTENADKKRELTNGMNWVIPIMFDPDAPLINEIEQLNPDFWKFELESAKSYKPFSMREEREQYFDFKSFMDNVTKLKTDFALYLGSETTPPCLEHTLYIINMKPLRIPNCQFKILRENSLLTNRDRETHARGLKENRISGPPIIRWIRSNSIKTYPRPIVPNVVIPNPKKDNFKYTDKVPEEIDRIPNCELKREMSR